MRKTEAKRLNPNRSLTDFLTEKQFQNKVVGKKEPNSDQNMGQAFKMSDKENFASSQSTDCQINDTAIKNVLKAIVKEEIPKIFNNLGLVKVPQKKGNERVLYIRKAFFQKFQKSPDEAPNIAGGRILRAALLYLEEVGNLDILDELIKKLQNFNSKPKRS